MVGRLVTVGVYGFTAERFLAALIIVTEPIIGVAQSV